MDGILQDRGIVPWLVQQPSKEECVRARKLKPSQMNRLESVWKFDPDATLEQVQVISQPESCMHGMLAALLRLFLGAPLVIIMNLICFQILYTCCKSVRAPGLLQSS